MVERPELVVFSQYKIGGVQSFYFNLLSNDPYHAFDTKWIFSDSDEYGDAKPLVKFNCGEEIIFSLKSHLKESVYSAARRLSKWISNREGAILTNFDIELSTLHLYRRSNKTIFYVCHDEGYLSRATYFEFIIDVFIAHNIEFYHKLQNLFPDRKEDIYFLPYGVKITELKRAQNINEPLKVVIAARLQKEKGVHDIPVINRLLKDRGVLVRWTIIGEGPEKQHLQNEFDSDDQVSFRTFENTDDVVNELAKNDIFILPSRLDGLPVAMLEAMSVGCVPVISRFNEGILEVVKDEVGYVLPVGDNEAFANAIADMHHSRDELEKKSLVAFQLVREKYAAKERSKDYFDLLLKYRKLKKRVRLKIPNYGGLLSHPWIPEILSKSIRKLKGSSN